MAPVRHELPERWAPEFRRPAWRFEPLWWAFVLYAASSFVLLTGSSFGFIGPPEHRVFDPVFSLAAYAGAMAFGSWTLRWEPHRLSAQASILGVVHAGLGAVAALGLRFTVDDRPFHGIAAVLLVLALLAAVFGWIPALFFFASTRTARPLLIAAIVGAFVALLVLVRMIQVWDVVSPAL